MKTTQHSFGLAFAAAMFAVPVAHGGGRYPMYITRIHGNVHVRVDQPGSRWKKAKLGALMGGPYLLRTGRNSYAHLNRDFRCVDSESLIRLNLDSEASIDVLQGQMSAVDGKRGNSLPDDPL